MKLEDGGVQEVLRSSVPVGLGADVFHSVAPSTGNKPVGLRSTYGFVIRNVMLRDGRRSALASLLENISTRPSTLLSFSSA